MSLNNSSTKSSEVIVQPEQSSADKFIPLKIEEIITQDVITEIFTHINPEITIVEFSCEKGTNAGDNYLSLMYAIRVETKINTTSITKQDENSQQKIEIYHIMFKTIPRNPARIEMIHSLKCFEREILMYNEILPIWRTKFGVNSFPNCLFAMYNGSTDYIAMENLKYEGYKMLPRYEFIDLAHATFTVQELAKLHAASYLQWQGNGELLLTQFPILQDCFWNDSGELNAMFVNHTFVELQNLLRMHKCEKTLEEKLAALQEGIADKIKAILSRSIKYPNVINHGDPWANNLLFKYDEKGNLSDMKFVDFQVAKIGSRVIDLSYLIYTSLQIPIMNANIMNLLRVYHETFTAQISSYQALASSCNGYDLSWETFIAEWETHRLYGLTMALLFCPAMNADPANIPDLETLSMDDFKKGGEPKIDKTDIDGEQDDDVDVDDEKKDFSEFMKSEHTSSRVINLLKCHV